MMERSHVDVLDQDLALDCEDETRRIARAMRAALSQRLRRRGVVVGISGGVDSAVCAALAARALGAGRVLGLLMPERDCPPDAFERAQALCRALGIAYEVEELTAPLEAAGCYRRRDAAIRELFPDYGAGWRQKIVLATNPVEDERLSQFDLVVRTPEGEERRARMPAAVYLQVTAATNMKQRMRKLMEYQHAERLNYAVLGTPNRLEYELGFFVRGGDGLADIKPIAHLYKSQVYALAGHLGVPNEIRRQPPSTDTYSLDQTQEEFYFGLPWHAMDRLLWALSNGVAAADAGRPLRLSAEQVQRAWNDIRRKRVAAARNLADAALVEPVALS